MPISTKQKRILAFPFTSYDGLICDGAIRSGKTSIMTVAFVDWAMRHFDGCSFALCGKTVRSAWRNIVTPFCHLTYVQRRYVVELRRVENYLSITALRGGKTVQNTFYIFGGKDESSQDLIQGITLAGVLFDEVALMPESFVNQGAARCSVTGSKLWFSCNPAGSDAHWFKRKWIDHAGDRNLLYLHFTMDDNPSLAPAIRQRYETMYSGVFYRRYILGEWVQAEGLVYPNFDADRHIVSVVPHNAGDEFYISIDYGTVNPLSAGLWRVDRHNRKAYREREYYFDSRAQKRQMTDEEYYAAVSELAGSYPVRHIIVDPSAASFIECIRRHGKYTVRPAVNDVLDGIRVVSSLLNAGMLAFHTSCADSIREFGQYSWDEKSTEERPIKEHDHAMDEIRYFCNTILRREFKWADWR